MSKGDDTRELLRAFLDREKTPTSDQDIKQLAADIVEMLQEEAALQIPPNNEEMIAQLNKSVYDAINELLTEGKPKTRNRTKGAAHLAGALKEMPQKLIVPTLPGYKNSMSLHQDENSGAYLQPFRSLEGLRFDKGKMYFEGDLQQISEADLQNLQTREGIENIDLPLLGFFYSCILYDFMKSGGRELKDIIVMQVPELAARMGWQSNLSNDNIKQIVKKVQSFHNIVGVMNVTRKTSGKPDKAYYQVLNFEYYDPQHNTVAFSSPYMNMIISTIYNLSIKTTKSGKAIKKGNGDLDLLPNHSYAIDSSIVKERNKAAVQNVVLIVQTIETAGDNIPHLAARTIIERNEQLQDRLEVNENKRRLLQRVFSKTWELLRDKTNLSENYKDLRVLVTSDGKRPTYEQVLKATPLTDINPSDPALIPNMSTLNDLVFHFPHMGKHDEPTRK